MKPLVSMAVSSFFALWMVQTGFAQGGLRDLPPGKWWINKRLIAELKLSRDQQVRIEGLWMQNRRNLIDQKAELEERQLDLADLLAPGTIDESKAMKAFDSLQEARLAIERATFLMRLQIKNLLSPEQQQRLETISERLRQQRAKGTDVLGAGRSPVPAKK
jgi:Spy/CpxP family protein refolding chaperone